jgi:O-methyltransferase domain
VTIKEDTLSVPADRQQALAKGRGLLLHLTMQKVVSRAIWVLAKLDIADHLAGGPRPVGELARNADCDPDALYRVMRCTAAFGVFEELPERRFALTPAAEHLRSGLPGGVRDLVLMNGEDMFWRPYGELLHCVRTGKPGFQEAFGMPFFDYLDAHPDLAALFHRAMSAASAGHGRQFGELVDLSGVTRIADIGGGEGGFLAELLERHPWCSGVLYDRPDAVAGAARLLAEHGVADRTTVVPGSFFESVHPGCDAYVIKHVLHDWPDEDGQRILENIRAAIGADEKARLFIVERVVGEPGSQDPAWVLDVDMLAVAGGRERSVSQWRRLVEASGFTLVDVLDSRQWSILECRPSRTGYRTR